MKLYKLIFLTFIFSFTHLLALDEYVVLHVNGIVKTVSGAAQVKPGDKITSDQKIAFAGKGASLVIVNKVGKFVLTAPLSASSNQEIIVSQCISRPLKSNVKPTRTEDVPVTDVAAYFGDSVFVFVGEKLQLKLNAALTPGEEHFLIYRFKYKGQTISSRISQDKGIVTLDKKDLYTTVDKKTVIPADSVESVDILNYTVSSRSISKLAAFRAIWLGEELKQELKTLKFFYKAQVLAEDLIVEELVSYVRAVYGKTDEVALKNWIRHNVD
jgi:hypothetical protein